MRDLLEKLRVLNTVDPDSGDSLMAAEFKVCAREVVTRVLMDSPKPTASDFT